MKALRFCKLNFLGKLGFVEVGKVLVKVGVGGGWSVDEVLFLFASEFLHAAFDIIKRFLGPCDFLESQFSLALLH